VLSGSVEYMCPSLSKGKHIVRVHFASITPTTLLCQTAVAYAYVDERSHKLIQFFRNVLAGGKPFSSHLDTKAEDSQTLTIVYPEASRQPVHANFTAIPPQRHVNR
jgi:hypothetical protein